MGETAGIGAAATITNFDRYTYAAIGDNGYTAPPQATTEQGESGSDSGDTSATLGEDANADRSRKRKSWLILLPKNVQLCSSWYRMLPVCVRY